MKYDVEIFDVKENIPSFTILNSFYKKGEWKKFWDLINFKREKYPTYFILQNFHLLRVKNEKIGEKIDDLIILYNHKMVKNHFVIYDFHKKLNPNQFNSIFFDTPGQYGLRGDPELWQDLTKYFENKQFPKDEKELVEIIKEAIEELTENSIQDNDRFFVKKYYNGSGMSGGIVSSEFWNFTALPILIGRYKKLKNFR